MGTSTEQPRRDDGSKSDTRERTRSLDDSRLSLQISEFSDSDIELDEIPEAALVKPAAAGTLGENNETDNNAHVNTDTGIVAPLFGRRGLVQGDADDGIVLSHPTGHAPNVLPVYVTIHRIRRLVIAAVDDPYTLDQLKAPRLNNLVVKPLVDKLYNPDDLSVVYCLLANRVQFLRHQLDEDELLYQTVNIARATLCELVAARVLRRFHEDHPDRPGLLLLANVLVSGFDPFDAAPDPLRRYRRSLQWPYQDRGGHERKLTALELAILSESKILIGSLACQRVVNAVYHGVVVYTPLSFVDILPDHYKHHPVSLYEPRRASILNHRRLIVPRLRNILELSHFAILLVLYVLTMTHRNDQPTNQMSVYEAFFDIFTAGWVLEQFAAIIEHGWEVHAQNLWSFLDVTFIFIFLLHGIVRIVELFIAGPDTDYALPILATAAPVLLTRIAFTFMPDNIVFIALHAMMRDFTRLTFIAIWCFTGFLLGLLWLMRPGGTDPNITDPTGTGIVYEDRPSWATIGKWLLWIWFGLDGTGLERTADFHSILGPVLAVTFAFLGNTLFLTILVAMLTNTFSKIIANKQAEIEYRRAVLTFQGVKSDSIFSYPPPFNMLALVIMLPLKMFLGPAKFHQINVAVIRAINAPVLLLIALYERRRVWARSARTARRGLMIGLEEGNDRWHFGLNPYADIHALFRADPPAQLMDMLEGLDKLERPHGEDEGHEVVGRDFDKDHDEEDHDHDHDHASGNGSAAGFRRGQQHVRRRKHSVGSVV